MRKGIYIMATAAAYEVRALGMDNSGKGVFTIDDVHRILSLVLCFFAQRIARRCNVASR
jgi:hypothetical protein